MMKKTIHILGALTIAAALTAGFTACTNDDNITVPQPAAVQTYTVSIPAAMPSDGETRAVSFDNSGAVPSCNNTFADTDMIYMFNVTTGKMLSGYLVPDNISGNGKTCDLTGTLTGTINNGDELKLFYNMNCYYDPAAPDYDPADQENNHFNYSEHDGTAENVVDGAIATGLHFVNMSGGVLTTDVKASFQVLQSIFRFQFQDESSNPITVKGLRIYSKNYALPAEYLPLMDDPYGPADIFLLPASPTSGYLYMALCIDESNSDGDVLTFAVVGDDDKVYQGTKAAPGGGFKNGKYYYNNAPITLTYQYTLTPPTIGWTKVYAHDKSFDIDAYRYDVWGTDVSEDDIDFTLSGTSKGCYFSLNNGGSVTLNGITAQYDLYHFIEAPGLTLTVSGTNRITCLNWPECINAYNTTMKLRGDGTLTVTANTPDCCGLYCWTNYDSSNNDWETTTQVDVSAQLADTGYKVTRSARVNGPDSDGDGYPDYYTWTYTVATAD